MNCKIETKNNLEQFKKKKLLKVLLNKLTFMQLFLSSLKIATTVKQNSLFSFLVVT